MTDNEIANKAIERVENLTMELVTTTIKSQKEKISELEDKTNRQNAEIEGLKKQNSISQRLLSEAWHSIEEKDKFCETVKTEAIREFAKFLIDNAENRVIDVSDLPDLVMDFIEKELENDKN